MRLAAGSATDTGFVRANNEDSFLVDNEHVLYAIADGMGGHRGGEVASRTAIEALRASVAAGLSVQDAIDRANAAVIDRATGDEELTGMGTTMTAVVVAGGRQLLIGHVGDSRAYLLHDGILRRITDDHSLVEELVREGRLTPEQAESHPQRAIVTRALGVDTVVDVDLYTTEVAAGDRILLCSDGLTTMVRDRDIERLLRGDTDPQRAAEILVDAANRAGGEDNTSVVVIDVVEVDAPSAPDPEMLASPPPARRVMPPAPDPLPPPTLPQPRHVGDTECAARCCSSCRSSLCSRSRPQAWPGTRAGRTTSVSQSTTWSSTRACRAGCSDGTRPSTSRHGSPTANSHRSITTGLPKARRADRCRGRASSWRHSKPTSRPPRRRPRRRRPHLPGANARSNRRRSDRARLSRPPADRGPRADRPPTPSRRAVTRRARRDHRGRRIHPGGAGQRTDASARPRRTLRLGVRSVSRRTSRDPAFCSLRGRDTASPRRAVERDRLRHRSRGSIINRPGYSRSGSRSGSACS